MINLRSGHNRLTLLILLVCICGCTHVEKTNSAVYVYFDVTEGLSQETKTEYLKSLDQIYKRMDMDIKKRDGGTGYGEVHLSLLNYKYFTKPVIISIDERDESFENEVVCKKRVQAFLKSFQDTLKFLMDIKLTHLDTCRSVIIKHIFEGLQELKNSNYNTKIMVIFSDMIEHNPEEDLSFISGQLDENSFEAMIKKMEKVYKIKIPPSGEFADIAIYIIRPGHEKYRNQRLVVENFWRHIFGDACRFQSVLRLIS